MNPTYKKKKINKIMTVLPTTGQTIRKEKTERYQIV